MTSQAPRQIKTTVGQNIRAAREAKGWKQRELAAAIGTEGFAVSRWERGDVKPGDEYLVRIAMALDCEVAWFYMEQAA